MEPITDFVKDHYSESEIEGFFQDLTGSKPASALEWVMPQNGSLRLAKAAVILQDETGNGLFFKHPLMPGKSQHLTQCPDCPYPEIHAYTMLAPVIDGMGWEPSQRPKIPNHTIIGTPEYPVLVLERINGPDYQNFLSALKKQDLEVKDGSLHLPGVDWHIDPKKQVESFARLHPIIALGVECDFRPDQIVLDTQKQTVNWIDPDCSFRGYKDRKLYDAYTWASSGELGIMRKKMFELSRKAGIEPEPIFDQNYKESKRRLLGSIRSLDAQVKTHLFKTENYLDALKSFEPRFSPYQTSDYQ